MGPDVLPGQIILWHGSIIAIPSGYSLCNGSNGTPDLRDKFVAGSGTAYNPGDTGGSVNHQHDFTGDGHGHAIPVNGDIDAAAGKSAGTVDSNSHGTTDNGNVLPPYYSLAYIMKL